MTLKTGFALLTGLVLGMGLAAELQANAYARKITALQATKCQIMAPQIASCAKADRADVR
jgi:hypothetical protein